MSTQYLVNYNNQGAQDLTIKLVNYDDQAGTIDDLEYTDAYHNFSWMSFASVQIEALSNADIANGYDGYIKIVCLGRNTDSANQIFFVEPFATGIDPQNNDYDVDLQVLLFSSDWSALWWQSGLVSATVFSEYMFGLGSFYGFEALDGAVDWMNGTPAINESGVTYETVDSRTFVTFDGVDDFIELPDSPSLSQNEWTIFLWFKTSAHGGVNERGDIITQTYHSSGTGQSIGLTVRDGYLMTLLQAEGEDYVGSMVGTLVSDGMWHSAAFVLKAESQQLYIDGTLVRDVPWVDRPSVDSDANIFLGCKNGLFRGEPSENFFNGSMDSLHFYARAMEADEVNTLHGSTIVVPQPTVTLDQDPSTVVYGDTLTATVNLQGKTLNYFAWEKFDGGVWSSIAGGVGGQVVDLPVTEDLSEAQIQITMRTTENNWYSTGIINLPPISSALAYWPLDIHANDDIGSIDGALNNVVFESDAGRNYAYFAGGSSYIDLGQSQAIPVGTGDFTITAWVRADNIAASAQQVFGSIITSSASGMAGVHILIHEGNLKFNLGGGGSTEHFEVPLPPGFEGTWNHIAAVRSGTNIKVYINAAEYLSTTAATVYNIDSTVEWHRYAIGAYNWGNNWYANYVGGIDEVGFYSQAFGPAKILEKYLLHSGPYSAAEPTVTVSAFSTDSFDDGWNGGYMVVRDSIGRVVQVFNGPDTSIAYPSGLLETMTLTAGETYLIENNGGPYPSEIGFVISDADNNQIVSITGQSGDTPFTAPDAAHLDWTHGGMLENIVHVAPGADLQGNLCVGYIKANDNGTTTLYFTADVTNSGFLHEQDRPDLATPVWLEAARDGLFFLATADQKIHAINVSNGGADVTVTSFDGLHDYQMIRSDDHETCIIVYNNGDIATRTGTNSDDPVVLEGTVSGFTSNDHQVLDIAGGPDGWALCTINLAEDQSEVFLISKDWATINAGPELSPDLTYVTEANYYPNSSQWIFSDGEHEYTAQTLSEWVQALPAPVGHWSFDNGDATADVGTDGVATGATFGTEESRTVIQYDGSGDYVTIPYSEDLVPQSSITVASWVKFDANNDYYHWLVKANGTTTAVNSSYALYRYRSGVTDGNSNKLAFRTITSNGQVQIQSLAAVETDRWYHVVGTYDGSEVKLYVDGVLQGSAAQSGLITRTAGQPIYLNYSNVPTPEWSNPNLDGGKWQGAQDDVRIYSMALDASQINTLYNL